MQWLHSSACSGHQHITSLPKSETEFSILHVFQYLMREQGSIVDRFFLRISGGQYTSSTSIEIKCCPHHLISESEVFPTTWKSNLLAHLLSSHLSYQTPLYQPSIPLTIPIMEVISNHITHSSSSTLGFFFSRFGSSWTYVIQLIYLQVAFI